MKALGFGEVLFDCFPGYERIGGALFNVSAHLARLGASATIVTAVGDDELGRRALREIGDHGIDGRHVAVVPYPTGRADISLTSAGDADYTFNAPCAWDAIPLSTALEKDLAEETYDVFLFGTLASRAPESAKALETILSTVRATHVFFDVNFRKDFYSRGMLLRALERTTILKVNEEELPVILSLAGVGSIDGLIARFGLSYLLLTLGAKGSALYSADKVIRQEVFPTEVVDTVGAGDSLSAAFLFFLLRDGNAREALRKASLVASFVVSSRGAVPAYPRSLTDRLFPCP